MQKRSVRFVAVFAVLAMVIAPLAAATFESCDSNAEDSVDYTKYYYNQLDSKDEVIATWIYDAVVASDGTSLVFSKEFKTSDLKALTDYKVETVESEVSKEIQDGVRALSLEKPLSIYWIKLSQRTNTKCTYLDPSNVTKVEVTVTFESADYDSFGTKAAADVKINEKIKEISSTLDKTTKETMIKGIHDKLCSMLTYDSGEAGKSCEVRSVYTALVGTGHVVCEGYAKSFKALCDYNNIPCLILTGDAGTGSDTKTFESHMWNYVMMDNTCWYLVDVTWDDQTTTVYNYYLAGSSTVGFNETKVGYSHDPTRGESSTVTAYGFEVPALAFISANDPSYIVTYMSNGTEFCKVAVAKDEKMSHITENPKVGGKEFVRWCTDPECTKPWDWNNSVVKSDMTLYAQFTSDPVKITLKNGNDESYICVINNTSIQLTELVDLNHSGKKFLGWNTASDGSGIYYTSNDNVKLTEPITLYTVWESDKDDPITNAINQANEFLSGDSIISGVSNTNLSIAVCSGVLLLIGFLLIRIKK